MEKVWEENMINKFIETKNEEELINNWIKTPNKSLRASLISKMIPDLNLFDSIEPIIESRIGMHTFYVVKFKHPDLTNYFKLGISKDLKKRFIDSRHKINNIKPLMNNKIRVIEFQAKGAEEFETMIKKTIPPNANLKELGILKENEMYPGYKEFYTDSKLNEVLEFCDKNYKTYKNIIGVKRVN